MKKFAAFLFAFTCTMSAVFGATSKGATQAWVIQYVANNGGGSGASTNQTIKVEDLPVVASDEVSIGDDGETFQVEFVPCTNNAIIVTESTITNLVPNGTKYAWVDTEQAWVNNSITCLPRFVQEDVEYNHLNDDGVFELSTYTYYSATSPEHWGSTIESGITYMNRAGDETQRFRIDFTTISDDDLAAAVTPVLVMMRDILGNWFTMASRAVSNTPSGSGQNASYTAKIKFTGWSAADNYTAKHTEYATFTITAPNAMVACSVVKSVNSVNGIIKKKCINKRYDEDVVGNLSNWGLPSEITAPTLCQQRSPHYPLKASASQIESAAAAAASAAAQNMVNSHECKFEEDDPDGQKHNHDDYRGVDCRCNYQFKKSGTYCNIQLKHTPATDGCAVDCTNIECFKHNTASSHTGLQGYASEDGKNHWHQCQCGNVSAGGVYGGCNVVRDDDGNCTCIDCGQTWNEPPKEQHTAHRWQSAGDYEQCVFVYSDGTPCGMTREHSTKEPCSACANTLSNGKVCGVIAQHSGWVSNGDDYHQCKCGEKQEPHSKIPDSEPKETKGTPTQEKDIWGDMYTYTPIYEEYNWTCPDCGEKGQVKRLLRRDKEPSRKTHKCKMYGDTEDECTGAFRGHNCYCTEHPKCFLGHLWMNTSQLTMDVGMVHGCDYCRNQDCDCSKAGDSTLNHVFGWPYAKDAGDIGHTCICGAKIQSHDYSEPTPYYTGSGLSDDVSVDGTWGQIAVLGTLYWIYCPNDGAPMQKKCVYCGHVLVFINRSPNTCNHTLYAGKYLCSASWPAWNNCTCIICGATRPHNFAGDYGDEGDNTNGCTKYRCINTGINGQCNVFGTSEEWGDHTGWWNSGTAAHKCECGEVIESHNDAIIHPFENMNIAGHNVATELTCTDIHICSNGEHNCGAVLKTVHNFVYGNRCNPNLCKICGCNAAGQSTKAVMEKHIFDDGQCVCRCGTQTKHAYPEDDEIETCGCFCGMMISPHAFDTNSCECAGVNAMGASHAKEKRDHIKTSGTRTEDAGECGLCGADLTRTITSNVCARCSFDFGSTSKTNPHDCNGVVNESTWYVTISPGRNKDPNAEPQVFPVMGCYEDYSGPSGGPCDFTGGGTGCVGGGASWSGGKVTITQTGWYHVAASFDGSGSYSFGAASCGGEGAQEGYGFMEAGQTYECSASCGNKDGPMSFSITDSGTYVGATKPKK